MQNRPEIPFFITGIAFMLIIAGIKYIAKTEIGLITLLVAFAFGGVLGILAVTPKDTFLKNIIFIAAFAWILWAILNPIQIVGNNWIINSTALLAIITFVIIFLESDFINIFNRLRKKPAKFGLGFFGIILTWVFLSNTGLGQIIQAFLAENMYIMLIILLAWLVFLYVMINKGITKLLGIIYKKLEK